jgi:hypothetical protein
METEVIVLARGENPKCPGLPSGLDFLPLAARRPFSLWHGRAGSDLAGALLEGWELLEAKFTRHLIALGVEWIIPALRRDRNPTLAEIGAAARLHRITLRKCSRLFQRDGFVDFEG